MLFHAAVKHWVALLYWQFILPVVWNIIPKLMMTETVLQDYQRGETMMVNVSWNVGDIITMLCNINSKAGIQLVQAFGCSWGMNVSQWVITSDTEYAESRNVLYYVFI